MTSRPTHHEVIRKSEGITRRRFLQTAGAATGVLAGLEALLPAYARTYPAPRTSRELRPRMVNGVAVLDLEIAETAVEIAGRRASAVTINGTLPGPLLHLQEGQDVLLRVSNLLNEDTSIHWHGVLLPPEMDGVPGVSFPGILPGQTFEYRFPIVQNGTYWYHSHSGLQEQLGHYGPLIIHPADGLPYDFDVEHTVVLSDWTFENPYRVLAKLKKQGHYYNRQQRTLGDFFSEVADRGLVATVRDRLMWAQMRMNPTDILDVTGATYTYLVNGLSPQSNWTALFRPRDRVLLRIINASAATYFDVRIPELPLTVVQSNGQYVEPVESDEFRIAPAETYDVIVEPPDNRAYTIFAEAMDRSGYARGTLAPAVGMSGPIPTRRERPVLTMEDMGMDHQNHGAADAPGVPGHDDGHDLDHENGVGHALGASKDSTSGRTPKPAPGEPSHAGHGGSHPEEVKAEAARVAIAGAVRTQGLRPAGTLPGAMPHESRSHGAGNAGIPSIVRSRMHEPGIGLGHDGWRVLTYTQLRSLHSEPRLAPDREIELHLTGNMERFMWSIDGIPFENSDLIRFNYGERIRLTMVNDTMMNHPMHIHGMWMELENGQGENIPRVHTVNVQPAERLSVLITADAPGMWAFHCHILYHMEVGMFRVVAVSEPGSPGSFPVPREDASEENSPGDGQDEQDRREHDHETDGHGDTHQDAHDH